MRITREQQLKMRADGVLWKDIPESDEEIESQRRDEKLRTIFGYAIGDKHAAPPGDKKGVDA